MEKQRLDEWLVTKGHYPSRSRARDAIRRGCITLSGDASPKPSRTIGERDRVTITDAGLQYVSRAALKLVHALEETGYSPRGRIALDIGASTGGFCQVLLEAEAYHVYGIDVGHGQIAQSLSNTPNFTCIEGLNARELKPEHLEGNLPEFLTSDVSFISLKLALPPALEMARPGAIGIFLIKPQFEVGKKELGKGGVVRNQEIANKVVDEIREWMDKQSGWKVTHLLPSPIIGGDGNRETLMAAVKNV